MADETTLEIILRAKDNASPAIKKLEQSVQGAKSRIEDLGRSGEDLHNVMWAINQRSQLLGKAYDTNAAKAAALRQTIEQLTLEGHRAEEKAMQDLAAQYRQATQAMEDTRRSTMTLSERLHEQARGFRAIGIAAGAAFAGIVVAIRDSVSAYNAAQAGFLGLDTVAQSLGMSLDEAREGAKSLAKDGLAPVATYATGLRDLLTAGLGLQESIRLIEVFKDRAAFGRKETISFTEAITNLTQSFKTERSQLADNSGMVENYNQILERGAQILGKKVTELTNAERAQAKYLAILEMSTAYEGNAARMANELQGAQSRLSQGVLDLRQNIGRALEPDLKDALQVLGNIVDVIAKWVDENPELARTILAISVALTGLGTALGATALILPSLIDGLAALNLSFAPFLVGGGIIAGLIAIVEAIRNISREAKLAAKDISKVQDIKEAQELVKFWKTEVERTQKAYARVKASPQLNPEGARAAGVETGPMREARLAAEKAEKNYKAAESRLAELTKTSEKAQRQQEETNQSNRTAADVSNDMNKALSAAETMEALLGDSFDLGKAKADAFRKALEELAELGIKPTDKVMKELADRLQKMGAGESAATRVSIAATMRRYADVQAIFDQQARQEAMARAGLYKQHEAETAIIKIEKDMMMALAASRKMTSEATNAAIWTEKRLQEARREAAWENIASLAKGAVLGAAPVANAAIQGAMAGAGAGPVGMAVGAIAGLITQSSAFAKLMEVINPLLQQLADVFGYLLAPTIAIAKILVDFLKPILEFVGEVFKKVAEIVAGIWNAFADLVNTLLGWLGVHIDKITLSFENASDAANSLADALRNVPSGFKIALARWEATAPGPRPAAPESEPKPKPKNEPRTVPGGGGGGGGGGEGGYGPFWFPHGPGDEFEPAHVYSYQGGGYVPRTGPAILHAGERVLTPEQQKTVGGITVIVQGPVYGMADFERKVNEAVSKAVRRNGLAAYGLAGA